MIMAAIVASLTNEDERDLNGLRLARSGERPALELLLDALSDRGIVARTGDVLDGAVRGNGERCGHLRARAAASAAALEARSLHAGLPRVDDALDRARVERPTSAGG